MCVCTQRSLPCGEGSSGKVLLGAAWFPFPPRASSEWDWGAGDPGMLVFTGCFPVLDMEGGLPSSEPPLLSGTAML